MMRIESQADKVEKRIRKVFSFSGKSLFQLCNALLTTNRVQSTTFHQAIHYCQPFSPASLPSQFIDLLITSIRV